MPLFVPARRNKQNRSGSYPPRLRNAMSRRVNTNNSPRTQGKLVSSVLLALYFPGEDQQQSFPLTPASSILPETVVPLKFGRPLMLFVRETEFAIRNATLTDLPFTIHLRVV